MLTFKKYFKNLGKEDVILIEDIKTRKEYELEIKDIKKHYAVMDIKDYVISI